MNGRVLTAKNIKVKASSICDWYLSQVKTDSIADWYKAFTERVESISKKLEDDYDPFSAVKRCNVCKTRFDDYNDPICGCCQRCQEPEDYLCLCDY